MILADGQSASARTALHFAQSAIRQGFHIRCLFFYHQGVYLASNLTVCPQDENDLAKAWQNFIEQHQLPAIACIASALKRGIINPEEAARYQRPADNLHPAFILGGLGSWLEAVKSADQHVIFKP